MLQSFEYCYVYYHSTQLIKMYIMCFGEKTRWIGFDIARVIAELASACKKSLRFFFRLMIFEKSFYTHKQQFEKL